MPYHVNQWFRYLPLEVYARVISFADHASLLVLARVSHFSWTTACPMLWVEVPDARFMLNLLDRVGTVRPSKAYNSRSYVVMPFEEVSVFHHIQQDSFAEITQKSCQHINKFPNSSAGRPMHHLSVQSL